MKHPISVIALLLALVAPAVSASLNVKFVESAPKDWFEVTNTGNCAVQVLVMEIDLSNSTGKLIFDTTASGAGVEVFQPFEVRSGNVQLLSANEVQDGEQRLSVLIEDLLPGESASFTIDVDDTLPQSELGKIRVSGAEISGSQISVTVNGGEPIMGSLDYRAQSSFTDALCG